jgi:hypothetical protein
VTPVSLDGAWLPHRHVIEALMSYVGAPSSIPVAVAHSKSSKPLERLSTQGPPSRTVSETSIRSATPLGA